MLPRRLLLPFVLVLVIAGLDVAARAGDLIRFKNGRSLSGKIVEESAETVTIELEGGGRLEVSRGMIEEILRDVPEEGAGTAEPIAGVLHSEAFFLWGGARRLGTRSLVVRRLGEGGFQLEEEIVFLDEEGAEDVRTHVIEECGSSLEPLRVRYRETSSEGVFALTGEVKGESLELAISLPGRKRTSTLTVPEGMKFPLAAREFAVRERSRLKGAWEVPVFDPREENFFLYRLTVAGPRRIDWEGSVVEAVVLRRARGERSEEEIWLDPAGRCLVEELNGPDLVAVLADRERVRMFVEGEEVDPSSEERRVRPIIIHPEAGFRLRKPSLSWTFEMRPPAEKKVLSLSSLRTFAYVDVFVLPEAPEGGLLSALAVDVSKRFAARSTDFEKLKDGFSELSGQPCYRMEARSTNKGEELRSLIVACVRDGKTWILAMACPSAYYRAALAEFEEILGSFRFLE